MPRLIVIVEDSSAIASSLALGLAGIAEAETVIFGNARDAARFLHEEPRALAALISDLNLPDHDGFSLIRQVRTMPAHRAVPVLLITAEEDPAPAHGDDLARPNAIIRKPFSIKEVRRVLESLL
jgi:two-component system chemotaxis response regulator CheY